MSNLVKAQLISTDIASKKIIFDQALKFFLNPFSKINRTDLKQAKIILNEIENWEFTYGEEQYSKLKNSSILVAYLAYRFGEILGLTDDELSDLYIAGLVKGIGKVYMCDDDKESSYKHIFSPLKQGDPHFKEISDALRNFPSKTYEYLDKNTKYSERIKSTASSYPAVYSTLFDTGYPNIDNEITQLDSILWFADSYSAMSFGSLTYLAKAYKGNRYVSLIEAIELLRDQTEEKVPYFWNSTTNATLMGVIFAMILGVSSPTPVKGANYSATEVVQLVNDYRKEEGLDPLNVDADLTQAAINKARDMLTKDYWDHYGPNGETPWQFMKEKGYKYVIAGENLAKGYNDVNRMHNAWINSPTHEANISNSQFDEIGVAVVDGVLQGKKVTLVVQLFADEKENTTTQYYNDIMDSLKDFIDRVKHTIVKE